MAYRGKTTCRILKDIRRQIAEANDIDLVIKECTYQGDCAGTCPRCEAEVAYLERELARRRALGKAACITGIATSALLGMPAAAQNCSSDEAHKVSHILVKSKHKSENAITKIPREKINPNGKYAVVVDGTRVSPDTIAALEPFSYAYLYSREVASLFYDDVPAGGLLYIQTTDTMSIRGLVRDEMGEPIVGASVMSGNTGTISKLDGYFELKIPNVEDALLNVVSIGYEKQTISVKPLMVVILEDSEELSGEVIYIGVAPYKKRKKR